MSIEPARPTLFSGDSPAAQQPPPSDPAEPEVTEGEADPATIAAKPPKRRATEVLPPSRIAVTKQLEILRGHVIAHSQHAKAVSNAELGLIVGMHMNNACLPNTFLVSANLLSKQDGGHIPSPEAINYARAYEWNSESAGQKLAPALERSWFGRVTMSPLSLRSRSEADLVTALGERSNAMKGDRPAVLMLLEFLSAAGLIVRDGELYRLNRQAEIPGLPAANNPPEQREVSDRPALAKHVQTTPFAAEPVAERRSSSPRGVQFSVDIDVDLEKMGGWSADRIAAFFSGLAQVIAAEKGGPTTKS